MSLLAEIIARITCRTPRPCDLRIPSCVVPLAVGSVNQFYFSSRSIDRSRIPEVKEKDIEENFISGSGPGGQSVNKSINCCQLKHKPTGIVVKAHKHRDLTENRKVARELLRIKLDNLYNGEASIEAQKKRIYQVKTAVREAQHERRKALKELHRKSNSDSLPPTKANEESDQ